MADLRIVDAPDLPLEELTEEVKIPTGGKGNYAVKAGDVATYVEQSKDLANKTFVNNSSNGVKQQLDAHKNDKTNPHSVTKDQIGLDKVNNTADLDKPVSNATSAAIITAVDTHKNDKNNPHGVTKAQIGLGNVDNTSDLNKPVSNATSDAITAVTIDKATKKEVDTLSRLGGVEFWKGGEYPLNGEVRLVSGDVVKSTVANNTKNPNLDMTGWDYTTKRQDFKQKSIFDYMTATELNRFYASPPRTFSFTSIINRAVALLNSTTNGTVQAIHLPAITGGYLTTECLWIPKCVALTGDGATMWNTDLENVNLKSSMIYADFAEKDQWIISSDTRTLSTGERLAYNAYFTGPNSDSKEYSLCDGIQIVGLQVHAKNRVFGGVRLFGAVGSYISQDTVVSNCEYCYITSASWESEHLGSSKYGKCGYLGYDQNNSTKVSGYHNPIGNPIETFTNMLNFFQDGYDIPYQLMNATTSKFGVVVKKADNVMLDVTCEQADFNVVLDDRVRGSGNLYLEVPVILGLVLGNQCEFNMIGCGGAIKDADAVQLGYNSILIAPTYAFLIENGNHMYRGMSWSPTSSAQLPSKYFTEYHQNIVWSDKSDNIVYITPDGSNKGNGSSYISPTNLTQAIKRISNEAERYDNTLKVAGNKAVVFYLIEEGEYTLNEAYLSLFGRVSIKKKSTLSVNNTILNMTNFVYLTNCELDISSVTLNIPNITYDYVTWARNAPFLNNRGINSLVLNNVVTDFKGVNNAIMSYANGSDEVSTLNIAGGSVVGSGLLVQTPESLEVGGTTHITVGSSCAVDVLTKGKQNGGIGIAEERRGFISLPWLLRNTSITYTPPSIPVDSSVSTTVELTGAVVGDFVKATFTNYDANIEISADVSSSGVVAVKFKNKGTSVIDLASGTLTVKKI